MNVVAVDANGEACHACGGYPKTLFSSGEAMCSLLCSSCIAEASAEMKPGTDDNLTDHQRLIAAECDALKAMLLEKNENYGDAALDPVRISSKASPVEQILVRIDDKLSRLVRGKNAGEDVEKDLAGYFVLPRVARKIQGER